MLVASVILDALLAEETLSSVAGLTYRIQTGTFIEDMAP
jgi:hypothetical protein